MMRSALERAFYKLDRERLLREQKNKCYYCGTPLTKKTATMDHVIPRKQVRYHTTMNCVVSCGPCNSKKGHKPKEELQLEEYEIILAEGLARLDERIKQMQYACTLDTKGSYRKWKRYWEKQGRWNK